MRRAGNQSWRFAEDLGQIPHALLYVRDALSLAVDGGVDIPPRLDGEVADHPDLLDDAALRESGRAWTPWWTAALAREVRRNRGPDSDTDQQQWMRGLIADGSGLVDAPEWSSLADWPDLRRAAGALFAEGCRWVDDRRRPLLPPAHDPFFDWHLTRDMAQTVAAETGVDIGAVHGCALVFLVQGRWWVLHSPGVVLCSVAATKDQQLAGTILRTVFSSAIED